MNRHKPLLHSEKTDSELFDSAFKYAAIGMALVALDGRWLKVNESVSRILGYSEKELLKTNFQAITHPEDLKAGLHLVKEMLEGKRKTYQMEKRYLHKDGHTIWALLSVSLVWGSDRKPAFFIAQIQDITVQKKAEAEEREASRKLQEALAERDKLRKELLTICAWTKKVNVEGKWISVETFLKDKLGISTSHGISDEAKGKLMQEVPKKKDGSA